MAAFIAWLVISLVLTFASVFFRALSLMDSKVRPHGDREYVGRTFIVVTALCVIAALYFAGFAGALGALVGAAPTYLKLVRS